MGLYWGHPIILLSQNTNTSQIPTFLHILPSTYLQSCTTQHNQHNQTHHSPKSLKHGTLSPHHHQPPTTNPFPHSITSIQWHPLRFPPSHSCYTNNSFTPPNGKGDGNIVCFGVFNGPIQTNISTRLPEYPNILHAKILAIVLAAHHT